jgi:hypothetical protein
MRSLLAYTSLALLISLSPASAMCGGDQQAGGGMCGKPAVTKNMSERVEKEDPTSQSGSSRPELSQQKVTSMCACCKNMAMMDNKADPHKDMEVPKQ